MRVMHRFAPKLLMVFHRTLSTRRKRAVIAMAEIIVMIDVSIEMFRSVEPGSSADKDAARKPLRAIIAVRRAIVRRYFVVSVGADWWGSDFDSNPNLSWRSGGCRQHSPGSDRQNREISQQFHFFLTSQLNCGQL